MPPSPVFSSTCSASSSTDPTSDVSIISNRTETPNIEIPVEIVSEEEMALIEAALSAATAAASSRVPSRSWAALSHCRRHTTSPRLMPSLLSQSQPSDIEDSAKPLPKRSLFREFRARRGLTVTDITATEWCEKQMEYALLRGKPKRTEAMIAGSNRHVQLEDEVVERIEIQTKSIEDLWAVKFLNFIVGVNQLLFEGVTRELPVVGLVEGVWLKGVIDEVRMPIKEALNPVLLDTKNSSNGDSTFRSTEEKC
ncbi:hypothetical protein HPP92_013896 [Vanilla planifolia]|uniref:Uncharacterized protein n=1 Tax=Vanilla planifolia TaxID=51239 RepID=A0A835UYF1_VANPL|nr:hypothetical protein HPP92_013896 [Vanilla planifolia]